MSFLSIKNVSKIYHTKSQTVHALNDVSIDIQAGEIFGLLGVNGAGKTTLSSILATIHPPSTGDVLFNNVSIYTDLMNYRRSLGFCPQHQNLDQELTVQENLIFAGRYFLMAENAIAHQVAYLLEALELKKYAHFPINALSGGNKQRTLIARALMHNPKIVILDEPTVGLDPDIRKKLWEIIRSLKNHGITIILTTHYLDEAEALSDRICILHKGTVQLIESLEVLKQKHAMAKLEDIFLKLTAEYAQEL